jgi:hypothetical protein
MIGIIPSKRGRGLRRIPATGADAANVAVQQITQSLNVHAILAGLRRAVH